MSALPGPDFTPWYVRLFDRNKLYRIPVISQLTGIAISTLHEMFDDEEGVIKSPRKKTRKRIYVNRWVPGEVVHRKFGSLGNGENRGTR